MVDRWLRKLCLLLEKKSISDEEPGELGTWPSMLTWFGPDKNDGDDIQGFNLFILLLLLLDAMLVLLALDAKLPRIDWFIRVDIGEQSDDVFWTGDGATKEEEIVLVWLDTVAVDGLLVVALFDVKETDGDEALVLLMNWDTRDTVELVVDTELLFSLLNKEGELPDWFNWLYLALTSSICSICFSKSKLN